MLDRDLEFVVVMKFFSRCPRLNELFILASKGDFGPDTLDLI
jgi:hypothetical protein